MDNNDSQPLPSQPQDQNESLKPKALNQSGIVVIVIAVVTILVVLGVAGYYFTKKSGISTQPQTIPPNNTRSTPSPDSITNWETYRDSSNMFELRYPLNLYVKGGGGQTFLAKKDATSAEIDYSDQLVEIRVDNGTYRFNNYYNTQDNSIVQGYSDLKLRSYTIGGYKAVEYGYDESKKEEEIQENRNVLQSGASVGMIYFNKGIILNKNGTIIEISTNAYYGEFKNTFDQILATLQFVDEVNGKLETIILQDGYSFDITLPAGYQYKKERQGDHLGYIADKNGEPYIRFLVSSGGGELSPKGKTTIDSVPFTIDYRENIGCNADLYPANAKYPGGNSLYFQIMAKGCKDDKEWLAGIPDKDIEQVIMSMRFNPRLKELLLGKTAAPLLQSN